MNDYRLVKAPANDKMFYYLRLLDEHQPEPHDPDTPPLNFRPPANVASPTRSACPGLTVMLGHVRDGTTDFVPADTLYLSWNRDAWGTAVDGCERDVPATQLRHALTLVEERFGASVRQSATAVVDWTKQPSTPVGVDMKHLGQQMDVLHRLHEIGVGFPRCRRHAGPSASPDGKLGAEPFAAGSSPATDPGGRIGATC